MGGRQYIIRHVGIRLDDFVGDGRVVVAGQRGQCGRPQGVVGRLAGEPEHNRDARRPAHLAQDLKELKLLGAVGPIVGQHVQGFRERLGLALAQAERDRLPAVFGQGFGQLGRQPGQATGPRRPPRTPPSVA